MQFNKFLKSFVIITIISNASYSMQKNTYNNSFTSCFINQQVLNSLQTLIANQNQQYDDTIKILGNIASIRNTTASIQQQNDKIIRKNKALLRELTALRIIQDQKHTPAKKIKQLLSQINLKDNKRLEEIKTIFNSTINDQNKVSNNNSGDKNINDSNIFTKVNINSISVPTKVIPEEYKGSFQETPFTSVYNSNDVQKATEVPLYVTNGFSNANIVGLANCQDITTDKQAEAEKMREIRMADDNNTSDDEYCGRARKNILLDEAEDKKTVEQAIVEEEINTDSNTDSNGNQQSTNGQQKKLKPKTIILSAARNLESIQEDQKENDNNPESKINNNEKNVVITPNSKITSDINTINNK